MMMRGRRDVIVPAVRKELWTTMVRQLKAPDFRYTRKMGLLHETSPIPNITSIIPVRHHTNSHDDNCLFYFFGQSLPKRNLSPCFEHICYQCYGQDIRIQMSEGAAICGNCGTYQYQAVLPGNVSFLQTHGPAASMHTPHRPNIPREHTRCVNKRRNHFRYWLARIQGKETSNITKEALESIKADLSRHNELASYDTIRRALRRLSLVKYYNNTYYIQKNITGYALLDLTRGQENKLIKTFLQIQQPFSDNARPRVNMLYYSYLIKKFSEMYGWTEVSRAVPSLQSTTKIRQLDVVWQQICHKLNFPFVRSV